jgi:hypothetical protein
MDHGVGTGDGLAQVSRAAHVAPHHLHRGREVSRTVVHQDADVVPAGDEPWHERGPERPGWAGHEYQRHLDHLPSSRNSTIR